MEKKTRSAMPATTLKGKKRRRRKAKPSALEGSLVSRTVRLDPDILKLMDAERERIASRISANSCLPESMGVYRFIRRALHSSKALLEWAKVLKSHGK